MQTLSRWLSWLEADRAALAKLALDLRISENHLRDLMDWGEEIALRDGIALAEIFAGKVVDDIATDPRLGRADKVKKNQGMRQAIALPAFDTNRR